MLDFETPYSVIPPPWAIDTYKGVIVPGLQLSTRDGRRMGNAVVVAVDEHCSLFKSWEIATIVTDYGNKVELTTRELQELFHEPKWVMDFTEHNGYKAWRQDVEAGRD